MDWCCSIGQEDRWVTDEARLLHDIKHLLERLVGPPAPEIDDGICKKVDCPNFGGVWSDCPREDAASASVLP